MLNDTHGHTQPNVDGKPTTQPDDKPVPSAGTDTGGKKPTKKVDG